MSVQTLQVDFVTTHPRQPVHRHPADNVLGVRGTERLLRREAVAVIDLT